MKCFITRNHLRWLSRRYKRLMWWAVLLVHVDEIFLLQQICSVRVRVCLFFVQLCVSARRWKLLIAPVILFWPDPAAINHFRLWDRVGYDPMTTSQCPAVLLSSVKKTGRAVSKAPNSFLPQHWEIPEAAASCPSSHNSLTLTWLIFWPDIQNWFYQFFFISAPLSPCLFLTSLLRRCPGMVSSWRSFISLHLLCGWVGIRGVSCH